MMKLINYIITIFLLGLMTSCSNDDVPIVDTRICHVNVTVDLSGFFSCYDFTDTKHSVENAVNKNELGANKRFNSLNPAERYNSFKAYNSSFNPITIETRVLFYNNDNGQLVDSILVYTDNVDAVNHTIELEAGRYTAIATLTFRNSTSSYWTLKGKENLNTAVLQLDYNMALWSIMSYVSHEVVVGQSKEIELRIKPIPIGSLCYAYFQNFQCSDEIKGLMIKTEKYANGFKLNPKETNKFIYSQQSNPLLNLKPDYFSQRPSWNTFQSDVFDYYYILAPQCNISFGYQSDNVWRYVDLPSYDIENGKTYLAYWDYNHIENPYFGVADNNHWY